MNQKICHINELETFLGKEFSLEKDGEIINAFVVAFKATYYAYINSCPHTGISLNWQEDQFFSVDGLFLQCSVHGALFEPDNGLCVHGSCLGQHLKTLEILLKDDIIYLR